jgi:hypothetical protein
VQRPAQHSGLTDSAKSGLLSLPVGYESRKEHAG